MAEFYEMMAWSIGISGTILLTLLIVMWIKGDDDDDNHYRLG